MIKSFAKKPTVILVFLFSFFITSFASARVMMSSERRSVLRAEREFNAYEWTCELVQNDYDYVMTLFSLKSEVSKYNETFFIFILLGYGIPIFIFFVVAMIKYGTDKPLTDIKTLLLVSVLSVFPILAHKQITVLKTPVSAEIKQLKEKLNTLDSVDAEVLRTCKPGKDNVYIKLVADVNIDVETETITDVEVDSDL